MIGATHPAESNRFVFVADEARHGMGYPAQTDLSGKREKLSGFPDVFVEIAGPAIGII